MDKVCSELASLLKEPLLSIEVAVDEVYFYEKSKNGFLTVVVDKIGGIDLDTIVSVSKIVSEMLDGMEVPKENYILDVISKERGNEDEQ